MRQLMRQLILYMVLAGLAACQPLPGHGERCNPLYFDNDCHVGYTCLYPTAPVCGVAYCCAVGPDGHISDPDPNCQPDPTLSCAPDLSAPVDAGGGD